MNISTKSLKAIQAILVEELEQQMKGKALDANEQEQALRGMLQSIGQSVYGTLLSRMDEREYGVDEVCPKCGGQGKRVSRRRAQVLSVFGRVTYRRSYYQCGQTDCKHRWAGLDESQALRAGQATQTMSGLLALAGITVSFEEAVQQIEAYLQVQVSANTLRQETIKMGEKQAALEKDWMENSQDVDYLQERERDAVPPKRVYGSIDGAHVPLLDKWHEAKTVCWYQEGRRYGETEPRAVDIHYYTSLDSANEFGELLWATAVHHQADRAEELVFVCDGAAWIWKQISLRFPQAKQIVDWYHASEYLHAVSQALDVSPPEQEAWQTDMEELLWEGDVEAVMRTCQSLVEQVGEPARRLLSYYGNNAERMRYGDFREAGYFIGSGTVESACKQIVSLRLKRAGARWTTRGAEMTAKARTAWLSNTWSDITQLPWAA